MFLLGLTNTQTANAFNISTKAVSNAKNNSSQNSNFSSLMVPKVSRDKLVEKRPLLNNFFASVPPMSGSF
jgi:hypothetical protein